MITPKITGAIITALVIIMGVALLYPALRLDTRIGSNEQVMKGRNLILLTFNIVNSSQLPSWCNDLSQFLRDNNIHSTIFVTGIVAKSYPDCTSDFSSYTDIGSMSYTNQNLTTIPDYLDQLSQIREGKSTIDAQGRLNSSLFRAPYGSVDDNIYSLLSRSGIIADFSYNDHYNLYTDGLSGKTFYWFPIKMLNNLSSISNANTSENTPLMINYYNFEPIEEIINAINITSEYPHQFVSASELTKMELTNRNLSSTTT
jgi:peptidoglycan/xylan/chitin deacetylase (PgdA/CDA1 family)